MACSGDMDFDIYGDLDSDNEKEGSLVFPFVIGGQSTPFLARAIFNLLDRSSLVKCRQVSKAWRNHVDLESCLWKLGGMATITNFNNIGWASILLGHFSFEILETIIKLELCK